MGLHFKPKKSRLLLNLTGGTFLLAIGFIASIYLVSFLLGPPKLESEQNTIYYSDDGTVIGEESGVENRYWVQLDDMSPAVIEATLMIEDQDFYEHNGFDFSRILAAVISDIKSFSLKEGASTLTQQYARNLYLTYEKTWSRKITEAFYTVRLEMYYSKDEILEGYLNTIYYGHGAYGVEAASRYFFDKSASDLTLAESAMLAAIPKGPAYYSPFNDRVRAKKRQQHILAIMRDERKITEKEYDLAINEKMNFSKTEERVEKAIAPYFQDAVLQEVNSILQLDTETIRSGGYQIYTSLDVDKQKKLDAEINNIMSFGSSIEVGAIAMDPDTGGIKALVGGRNYEKSQFNRAMQAKRMAGSTFKPFLYYAALHNGYTPTTRLLSKPTAFELEDGTVYQPSNFNGYYAYEPITLAQALALSDNIYAVKTNMYIDPDKVVDTARLFSIDSKLPAVPSLALGTATVTVEEMVTGYSMLANGGQAVEAYTVKKIMDRTGKVVYERKADSGEQILDRKKAFILTHLMTGMFDRSLDGYMAVTGSTIANELTRPYAGKSGTTNSDSWMIGYSPSLVTGIWTGYDDNRPLEIVSEISYAKDIWAGFMEAAHAGKEVRGFPIPAGVVGVPIDPESGERATPYCETSRIMYFEKGTEPDTYCSMHFPGDEDEKEKPSDDERTEEEKGLFKRLFDMLF